MIAVVQRVTQAQVVVGGAIVGQIGGGLVALVAVHREDDADDVLWMANKLAGLRIFRNGDRHFDLDLRQAGGSMLLISNFTVAGQTRHGRRPSLDQAADPEKGRQFFEELLMAVRSLGNSRGPPGSSGRTCRCRWVNDGPVTFIVDSREGNQKLETGMTNQ